MKVLIVNKDEKRQLIHLLKQKIRKVLEIMIIVLKQ